MKPTKEQITAKLTEGTRFHYTGDMANPEGNGVISKVEPCDWYGLKLTLTFDEGDREHFDGSERIETTVTPASFMPGPGCRFEIEEYHEAARAAALAALRANLKRD